MFCVHGISYKSCYVQRLRTTASSRQAKQHMKVSTCLEDLAASSSAHAFQLGVPVPPHYHSVLVLPHPPLLLLLLLLWLLHLQLLLL